MKLKDEVKRARLIEQEIFILKGLLEDTIDEQEKKYLSSRITVLLGEEQ